MSERDSHESYEVFAGRLHWIAVIIVGSLIAIISIGAESAGSMFSEPEEHAARKRTKPSVLMGCVSHISSSRAMESARSDKHV